MLLHYRVTAGFRTETSKIFPPVVLTTARAMLGMVPVVLSKIHAITTLEVRRVKCLQPLQAIPMTTVVNDRHMIEAPANGILAARETVHTMQCHHRMGPKQHHIKHNLNNLQLQ